MPPPFPPDPTEMAVLLNILTPNPAVREQLARPLRPPHSPIYRISEPEG